MAIPAPRDNGKDTVLSESAVIGTVILRQFANGGIAIKAFNKVLGERYVFIDRDAARKLLRLLLDEALAE